MFTSKRRTEFDKHFEFECHVRFFTIYFHDLLTLDRYEYSIKKEDDEDDEKLKILMSSDEKKDENVDEEFVQKINDENDEDKEKEKEKDE